MDLALFDFDGTITHQDTFTPFIFYAASKNRVRLGKLVLLPLLIKYKLGWSLGGDIRERVFRFALKGVSTEATQAKAIKFAADIIPNYIRSEALARINWHQQRGDKVVIVSASLSLYLQPWCQKLGVELICTEVESANGVLTGNYLGGDCSSLEKASRVKQRYLLEGYDNIYAYGDTPEDNEMLALANNRFYQCFK